MKYIGLVLGLFKVSQFVSVSQSLSANVCLCVCVWGIPRSGSVLFNDALNTFYLRLYRVGHMVKDHSDSE